MTRAIKTTRASSTLQDALEIMNRAGIRHLLVMKDGAKGLQEAAIAGILSTRDALDPLVKSPEEGIRLELYLVRDVMTHAPLIVIAPSATLRQAAGVMHAEKISALPVCEAGKVVGILTTDDVLASCSGPACS